MKLDCSQVADYIADAGAAELRTPPDDVRMHLDQCSACRKLWKIGAASESGALDEALEQSITGRMLESLEAVRPMPSRTILAAGFLTIFGAVSAAVVAFVGMRGAAAMSSWQLGGALAAVALSAALAASALSREMSPGSRCWMAPVVQSILALAAPLVAVALLFPWKFAPGWFGGTWHCFAAGFGFSIPAAVLAIALLGRGVVFSWPKVGAGAGLLAGLVGATVLHIACPMTDAPHVTVGHLSLPLVGALLGWLMGKTLPALVPRRSHAES